MTGSPICTEIIDEPSAWKGAELAAETSWIYEFSAPELAELDAALRRAQRLGIPVEHMRRDDFGLPKLAPRLREVLDEIRVGRGFIVLRGLPVARYTDDEVGMIFWGLGVHLGLPITQNPQGDLLGHVYDHGRKYGNIDVRGYETNAHLPFHSDAGDIVGLLCLRKAKSGGLSSIVSAVTIHNEILSRRPEYLPPLYRGFYYIRREQALTDKPLSEYRIPVFGCRDGKISCRLVRNQINAAAEKMGKPLDPVERAALDLLAEISYDPKFHLSMDLQAGDIQLINNYTTLHSRTDFEDWPDSKRGRHMLRLWLNVKEWRPMGAGFLQHSGYQQVSERSTWRQEVDARADAE